MANPRLQQLRDEFTGLRAAVDLLDAKCAAEKRDLTENERMQYEGACTRMEEISADITETSERMEKFDAAAEAAAKVLDAPSVVTRMEERGIVTYDPKKAGRPYRSSVATEELGEFGKTLGRAILDRAAGKISEDEVLQRVVAHGVAADGTAPVTIEGDLIKFVDANRYAVNRARLLPMPDNHAPTFKRPRATQRTTVATQVTEGDVLSSQRFQAGGDTVTKVTKGGVLSMSEQEIDWTDPALLGLAIQDLAESYAIETDDTLCTAIETAADASTNTVQIGRAHV